MKLQHAGTLPAAALLLLALFAPPAAQAQQRRPQSNRPQSPPRPTRPDPRMRPQSLRERQMVMEEMEREMGKSPAPRKSEELRIAEIAEDYRDLQQVNNSMMAAVMRTAEPDYDLINRSVADIRRRAERLRENLALPKPAPRDEKSPGPKPAEDAAGMKAALLSLDRSIMNFIRSPLFRNTDVLNAEAAVKASRDLADVIERSRLAGADAVRMGRTDKE